MVDTDAGSVDADVHTPAASFARPVLSEVDVLVEEPASSATRRNSVCREDTFLAVPPQMIEVVDINVRVTLHESCEARNLIDENAHEDRRLFRRGKRRVNDLRRSADNDRTHWRGSHHERDSTTRRDETTSLESLSKDGLGPKWLRKERRIHFMVVFVRRGPSGLRACRSGALVLFNTFTMYK